MAGVNEQMAEWRTQKRITSFEVSGLQAMKRITSFEARGERPPGNVRARARA
jgi:hypothetical protein